MWLLPGIMAKFFYTINLSQLEKETKYFNGNFFNNQKALVFNSLLSLFVFSVSSFCKAL